MKTKERAKSCTLNLIGFYSEMMSWYLDFHKAFEAVSYSIIDKLTNF